MLRNGWLIFFTLIFALMLGIGFMPAAHAKVRTTLEHGKYSHIKFSKNKSSDAKNSSKKSLVLVKSSKSKAKNAKARKVAFHQATDWNTNDLTLRSGAVLVLDQQTNQVLYGRNDKTVMPIASITKLMNAMVTLDAAQPMEELLTINESDMDFLRHSSSRLRVGTTLTRSEMLHLALMSSENRAANSLARYYPGGLASFMQQMNRKARDLGMTNSHFADPTGLDGRNVATAHDLAKMVHAAYQYEQIRLYTTSTDHWVDLGHNISQFRNSNRLVHNPNWEIGLSKTGYISSAGRCLVMQVTIAGKPTIMVLLDGAGKEVRTGDAIRIRRWMESGDNRAGRLG